MRHHSPFLLLSVAALVGACAPHGARARDTTTARLPSSSEIAAREQTADQQVHHVLNRLSFGARPGDVDAVRAIGVDRWVAQQLDPERIPDVPTDSFLTQFRTLGKSGEQLLADYPPPGAQLAKLAKSGGMLTAADSAKLKEQGRQSYSFVGEISTMRVARAVSSERQLQEVMVDFWENHFNVFAGKDRTRYFLAEYDANTIRPNVLGKFRDLLGAVAKSPAMLYYLDNWQSVADSGRTTLTAARRAAAARTGAVAARRAAVVKGGLGTAGVGAGATGTAVMRAQAIAKLAVRRRGLNENYARELMELHTLGVDGGYTQHDVTELARVLTGWTLSKGANGGEFMFRAEVHDADAKTIFGKHFPAGGGQEEGEAVLDMLAHSPNTARFIATKLVRRFVSDTPPTALVNRATATFRRTDGDIREVVRTIVTSPEFFAAAAYHAKVKSPFELVTSTLRAMNAPPDSSPRAVQLVSRLGAPIFGHLAPNGYPETGDAWMNTGAILNRINFGLAAAAGRVPGIKLADWPATKQLAALTKEQQVDGVIKELFGGAASPDTRDVLLTGTNPFLQSRAAYADSMSLGNTSDMAMANDTISGAARMARGRGADRGARRPLAQQQQAAGREAVKPAAGATLTQTIGTLPTLAGFGQIVGLALGAPEFQRR